MEGKIFEDGPLPTRTMIARVYRRDPLEGGASPRVSVELDGIDEDIADEDLNALFLNRDEVDPFGLLRVEVPKNLEIDGRPLEPGGWFRLTLFEEDGDRRMRAEHAQLTQGGYTIRSKGYVGDIESVGEDGDPPLHSVGASVAKRKKRAQKAINNGVFPPGAVMQVSGVFGSLWPRQPSNVRVRDVGQAGFVTLRDEYDRPLLHFDAGWPVSFNGHTAPATSTVADLWAPVVLSHWDWDHLHGYYVFPLLQNVHWFAPVQTLGPGASRVAAQLHSRGLLFGLTGGPVTFGAGGWGRLAVCAGPAGNKNQTGLVFEARVRAKDGTEDWVLMTGDADYQHAIAALGTSNVYSGLVVAHHGATFAGPVPSPTGAARAAISYGDGNTYGHPSATALTAHAAWSLERTATHKSVSRGCRYLP